MCRALIEPPAAGAASRVFTKADLGLLRRCLELAAEARRLADMLDEIQLLADRVGQTMKALATLLKKLIEAGVLEGRLIGDVFEPKQDPPRKPKGDGPGPGQREVEEEISVDSLTVSWRADSRANVQFGGDKAFHLPPVLGRLLEILRADDCSSGDELVAWKSFDDVAARLQKHFGREFTRHAVIQAIHRLRVALAASKVSKYLVQTNRSLGTARFAVRSTLTPALEPDRP